MMGFPCLRLHGDFFACRDVKSDALVVKLTEDRVTALIDSGGGVAFAPSGRPFKAWVVIASADPVGRERVLAEALQCATARTTAQLRTQVKPSSGSDQK